MLKKSLKDIFTRFKTEPEFSSEKRFSLDSILDGKQKFKNEIIEYFNSAIINRDKELLAFCISASFKDGIDKAYIELFDKIILETWHDEHEDIVDIVCQFEDDRFTDALIEIAENPKKYRKYDDEMESTLRKCFHALKAIKTKKSQEVLNKMIESDNPNIKAILGIYK